MTIATLGIDIAKNVFQLHGVNSNGRVLLKRRVVRDQLLAVVAQIERCTIVIEACTGAFCCRISRPCTVPASAWSITAPPWSARSGGCCSTAASPWPRASPAPEDCSLNSSLIARMS